MTSTVRSVLCVLFILLCGGASAQWLKRTESSDDLYKQAKKEIEAKRYQRAVFLLDQAVDISPRNLDIHLLLGRAFGLAGKTDSARIELKYVIEKSPKYKDAYIYLVNIETVACNYLQALEYADMGLKQFPNDRDLLLKKLDIYSKEGDWIESTKLADYLFERYSTDSYIRSVYLDYKLTLARQYSHRGYIEIAKRSYESVLEQDPLNKEALQAVFSLDVRSGNYESSLAYVNRALQSSPNSFEFLMKKVSILEAMGRYVEAIAVVEKLMKLYPSNSEVQKLNVYLRMEGGRFYMKQDPYLQFQSVLEKQPANREALNYVTNIAISRGLLSEALGWANNALKHYPNDRELLTKKMSVLENMRQYGAASRIAEKLYKNNPSKANKQNFIELRTLAAKDYMNGQEFDSAEIALKSVLFYEHSNKAAINYLINTYTQQKRYDDVLHTIDEALTYYPGNEEYLYRKSATLEAYQHYSEAALISKQLLSKYPNSRKYLVAFVEQSLQASRQSMQYDDYYGTIAILQEILDKQPNNADALNYMINLHAANKNFDSSLVYADQALGFYPENRDFKLKKSSVLAEAQRYEEAIAISSDLYNNYPYNIKYRGTYVDQLCSYGKQFLAENKKDDALNQFNKALEVAPKDTLPLYYNINLLMDMTRWDDALALIARGRTLYPNNTFFLLKRAQIYENQLNWKEAYLSADTLLKITPNDVAIIDYTEYLFSKRLKNEFGFSYLHTKIIDSAGSRVNHIATVHYTRRFKNGSITGRVNYAGRFYGTGYQFELEGNYTFAKIIGLNLAGSYSPSDGIFPLYRFAGALTFYFKKGWAVEVGGRALRSENYIFAPVDFSGQFVSGVLGISKEHKDMYFGLRGYVTQFTNSSNQSRLFYAGALTSRFYLNKHSDYFSTILGYGTIPDDFSRVYDLSSSFGGTIRYRTVSAGAGYMKSFHYRTSLGIYGTWYNIRTGENVLTGEPVHIQQFDVFITLLRKF